MKRLRFAVPAGLLALVALASCTSLLGDFNDGNATAGDDGGPSGDGPLGDSPPSTDAAHDGPVGTSDACTGDACTAACTGTMVSCEGHCVDTTMTGSDCGVCGHNCGGGACMNSVCQPKTLVSGLAPVFGFDIDATNVYFGVEGVGTGSVNTVSACPLAGCTGTGTVIAGLVGMKLIGAAGGSIAFVGNDPTISTPMINPSSLFACLGTGCPNPPLTRIAGEFPTGNFGFNELLGFGPDLYYQWNFPGATAEHGINRCVGLTGTTCTRSIELVDNALPPIAADATNAYFLYYDATINGNDLDSCPIGAMCTAPTQLEQGVNPSFMAVYGGTIFYATFYSAPLGGGPVFSCATTGCTHGTPMGMLTTGTVAGMTADASGVYFTLGTSVYTCPITGCSAAGPKVIATGVSPSFIKTDASFVYWVDQGLADAGTAAATIFRLAK